MTDLEIEITFKAWWAKEAGPFGRFRASYAAFSREQSAEIAHKVGFYAGREDMRRELSGPKGARLTKEK